MTPTPPEPEDDRFDAVVLAGGRASRLGGVPKPTLVVEGATLEHHALAATLDAERTVLVGPEPTASSPPALGRPGGREVVRTREDPPFGGPVAGLEAGLRALRHGRGAPADGRGPAPWVLVLAVDVPRAAAAVPLLRAAVDGSDVDGAYLVREGKAQWLVGLYRHDVLHRALVELGPAGPAGASVRSLVARLRCLEVPDDDGLSRDVDTWDDVRRLTVGLHDDVAGSPATPASTDEHPRARPPTAAQPGGTLMTDQTPRTTGPGSSVLDRWVAALEAELGLPAGTVDVGAVLDLARDAAHQVTRPAAPVSAYVAGYAAGLAAARGEPSDAVGRAQAAALAWHDDGPAGQA